MRAESCKQEHWGAVSKEWRNILWPSGTWWLENLCAGAYTTSCRHSCQHRWCANLYACAPGFHSKYYKWQVQRHITHALVYNTPEQHRVQWQTVLEVYLLTFLSFKCSFAQISRRSAYQADCAREETWDHLACLHSSYNLNFSDNSVAAVKVMCSCCKDRWNGKSWKRTTGIEEKQTWEHKRWLTGNMKGAQYRLASLKFGNNPANKFPGSDVMHLC